MVSTWNSYKDRNINTLDTMVMQLTANMNKFEGLDNKVSNLDNILTHLNHLVTLSRRILLCSPTHYNYQIQRNLVGFVGATRRG